MAYVKAKIVPENGDAIEVMFNPSEYTMSRDISYSEMSVLTSNNKIVQYASGGTDTLSLDLIFNTYNFNDKTGNSIMPSDNNSSMDVTLRTQRLYELTRIDADSHRPPLCTFKWSSLEFSGVISSFKQNFTMFLDDGTPVRAKVTISFTKVASSEKIPLQSPDRSKYRVMTEGTQLWEQAYKEYGDASKWREIARANNISNPLEVDSSDEICIPAL